MFRYVAAIAAVALALAITGLFHGDASQFFAQVIEATVCISWNVGGGVLFWAVGKVLGSNRVPPEVEIAGLDIPEMGAPGYPEFIQHMVPEQISASEVAAAKAELAL
jgi:ammonia channel protein AmtB